MDGCQRRNEGLRGMAFYYVLAISIIFILVDSKSFSNINIIFEHQQFEGYNNSTLGLLKVTLWLFVMEL